MASQYDIPWYMLKGLDPTNAETCTLKGSVTTGMEPSARDEIAVKLRSVAYIARGRVFFDVKIDQMSEALKLRSLDHVHVLVVVNPKFGFVKNKETCLRRLRLLPRELDWKKALSVWQSVSGFQGEPHTRRPDDQLEAIEIPVAAAPGPGAEPKPADPLLDFVDSMRQPVKGTRPEDSGSVDEGKGEPASQSDAQTQNGEGGAQGTAETAAGDAPAPVATEEPSEAAAAETEKDAVVEKKADVTPEGSADATVTGATDSAVEGEPATGPMETVPANADTPSTASTEQEPPKPADAAASEEVPVKEKPVGSSMETSAPPTETGAADVKPEDATEPVSATQDIAEPAAATQDAAEPTAAAPDADASAPPARVAPPPPPEGAVSFRATCYRAGGGKQGHAFSSNEGAQNFGGAVQELFNWKVQMKGYDLEVILDVDFDMVSVGLSLTPRALFYRNLAKTGPTSLRSTVCYGLLMMAKPQPYEVVVDPMCGGGSISLEGAQAFPGTFHICGDNYPDAAPRVLLNREFSARQLSPTAQLPLDVLTWDCTRLPLRDGCADVIVSDLPFGKRLGSKFDNRTLYPACMEEMARICTPRYGRAVLLTQDRRTMEKTLQLGRIKSLWRCRASPYVNIGGLEGIAYFLQRSDMVRRRRPPQAPVAAALRRAPPQSEGTPAAPGSDPTGKESETATAGSPATAQSGDAPSAGSEAGSQSACKEAAVETEKINRETQETVVIPPETGSGEPPGETITAKEVATDLAKTSEPVATPSRKSEDPVVESSPKSEDQDPSDEPSPKSDEPAPALSSKSEDPTVELSTKSEEATVESSPKSGESADASPLKSEDPSAKPSLTVAEVAEPATAKVPPETGDASELHQSATHQTESAASVCSETAPTEKSPAPVSSESVPEADTQAPAAESSEATPAASPVKVTPGSPTAAGSVGTGTEQPAPAPPPADTPAE
ncbi:uncharacterized protein LOC122371720 [Amphibalanus amphitrite]|uniref:uncharacterized protein LOC122371720 n=1 Tax=Amphibalanus amphitrite TaxID=1232801 RepID=UPI001C91B76E|nr:uncharacterized protein LOC122371720 [Amphibalanus amphitrite]XP_043204230.1 uncharacterized protein LOC122371720 [Amphibalanus amphitrite]XP_043204231.1 uncharacterized protein LOC122371720 [Amphibalanus amphitrite]XP_043204232.1 uncharacterized protein LOC122371720 [Amphibalanus amphitrite]XP_043204233.1 uncharacterized protein LOC122371720 [Amphibalanus amphitrite]XP_043204235.1 uncharacterized protein LOC122371720 [Amphibalanus amphitrite]XP_043204236.1 uncharacterized protein LOC12237